MEWYFILFIIVFIIINWVCYQLGKQTVKPIEINNKNLLQEQEELIKENKNLQEDKIFYITANYEVEKELKSNQKQIQILEEKKKNLKNEIFLQEESAKNGAQALYQNQVIQMNTFFEQDRKKLQNKYDLLNQENESIKQDIENNKNQLKSLQETRAAVITAAQQEKQISENKDFYCLTLSPQDLSDINILRQVTNKISKPRSILMAIWQAYYQPVAKKKFPQILGKNDVCGIYKITNQQTGECYIGQARDVRKRWYKHCHCGIGIDTPQGSQLYKSMLEYGLDNFSFELLLECSPQELNEKEKYFIELYNSNIVGFNIVKGNS